MNLRRYADQTLRESKEIVHNHYKDGDTKDIIEVILLVDKLDSKDSKDFAKAFKGSIKDICKELWSFIRNNITYIEDGYKVQDIKSPAALWKMKRGDCKSFSVFAGSVLKNLGISYTYRLVAYDNSMQVSHVYIIAYDENYKEIILDACWHKFNATKQYNYKKDKTPMTEINRIEGILGYNKNIPMSVRGNRFANNRRNRPMVSGIFAEVGDFINVFNDGPLGSWKSFFNKQFEEVTKNTVKKTPKRLNAALAYQRNLLSRAKNSGQLSPAKFEKLEIWSDRMVMRVYDPANFGDVLKWVFFPIGIFSTAKRNALTRYLREGAEFFSYLYLPLELLNDANPQAQKIRQKVEFQKKQAVMIMDGLKISQQTFDQIIKSEIQERHGKTPRRFILNLFANEILPGISGTRNSIGVIDPATIGLITLAVTSIMTIIGIISESKKQRRESAQQFLNATLAQGDFGPWACQYLSTLDAPEKMIEECQKLASDYNVPQTTGAGAQANTSTSMGLMGMVRKYWPVGLGFSLLALAALVPEKKKKKKRK